MVVFDGFEFLAELRKNPAFRHIPVVVLTAKDLTQPERDWLRGKVERVAERDELERRRPEQACQCGSGLRRRRLAPPEEHG